MINLHLITQHIIPSYTHKMANVSWPQILWRQFTLNRVGQKSKLLILSEYINKIEKHEECEQIQTATEKMEHCLIFSRKIFYVTIFLCLNILDWKQSMKLLLGKHELAYVDMPYKWCI